MPTERGGSEMCETKQELVTALVHAVAHLRSLKVASIDDFEELILQKNVLFEQFEAHLREHGC